MKYIAFIFAVVLMIPATPAQQRAATPTNGAEDGGGGPITVDVNVVSLYCAVRNKANGLVPNLTKDDFDLFEDGQKQSIRYFSKEVDIPLTMGLLVDVSGSQQNLIETERRAAAQFFTSVLKPKDVAFLISFGASSDLLQDVTGSTRLLEQGLSRLKLNAGVSGITAGPVPTMSKPRGTVLYDATYLAAHDMLASESGRKAVILITDGEDQGSKLPISEAIQAAQKADAIIYGILYVDKQFYGGFGMSSGGAGVLRKMAEETGGRMFEVDRGNTLEAIFTQIQQEMRTQYLIGYSPTNSKRDGTFRKIDLKAHNKDQKVQVRKGYYAPGA